MKPARQVECVELMVVANNLPVSYAEALLVATSSSLLSACAHPSIDLLRTRDMRFGEKDRQGRRRPDGEACVVRLHPSDTRGFTVSGAVTAAKFRNPLGDTGEIAQKPFDRFSGFGLLGN